jgi:hypothetical protein
MVFIHEIDPSDGDADMQEELIKLTLQNIVKSLNQEILLTGWLS